MSPWNTLHPTSVNVCTLAKDIFNILVVTDSSLTKVFLSPCINILLYSHAFHKVVSLAPSSLVNN